MIASEMESAGQGDGERASDVSLSKERNPLLGVPDVVLRVQAKSVAARILLGLTAAVLLALVLYWGLRSHELGTTLLTLVVVGGLVVASQFARRRREH